MRKKFVFLSLLMVVVMLLACCLSGCMKPEYVRSKDTECVILQISDLHLKTSKAYQSRAFRTIRQMVEETNPDIIVVTGDLTNTGTMETMGLYQDFGEFMEEEIKIPWYFTFGNHDPQGDFTKQQLGDYLESLEYCKYENGDPNVFGFGNQYVNVTDKNGNVIQTLFFLDSSDVNGSEHAFDETQRVWYTQAVKSIALEVNGNEADVVPSIMFQHIPVTEFAVAYEEALANDLVLFGDKGEEECGVKGGDDLFETIVEVGSTKGLFVGHDHLNDYVVEYQGIRLSYTETCDHKMYIPTRGGTLINIKSDGTFTQQNITRKKLSAVYKISDEF